MSVSISITVSIKLTLCQWKQTVLQRDWVQYLYGPPPFMQCQFDGDGDGDGTCKKAHNREAACALKYNQHVSLVILISKMGIAQSVEHSSVAQ